MRNPTSASAFQPLSVATHHTEWCSDTDGCDRRDDERIAGGREQYVRAVGDGRLTKRADGSHREEPHPRQNQARAWMRHHSTTFCVRTVAVASRP